MKKTVKKENYILLFALLLFTIIVYRNAWLGDDSFITFRTVDNFINGYGLRWNIAERVQSYTHPLWMFLLSFFYFFTREIYFTSLFVSITISVCAVSLFSFKIASSRIAAVAGVILLASSKAFIDYTTSGLENPLSYLLAVLFFIIYLKKELNLKTFIYLSLITSLSIINRQDTALIYIPPLAFYFFKLPKLKAFKYLILGFIPLIVWELFSLIYYGFLFPNTAYAKLNTGIDKLELIQRGFAYLVDSLTRDPLTLSTIALSIIALFKSRKSKNFIKHLSVFGGILLYIVYIIKIGGCFMSGRFFSVPFFVSIMLVSNYPLKLSFKHFAITGAVWLIFMFMSQSPPFLRNTNYGLLPGHKEMVNSKDKIADEQLFYFQSTGLINLKAGKKPPYKLNFINFDIVEQALKLKKPYRQVFKCQIIGMLGFYAGPNLHIVDPFALSDPLLARMPAIYTPDWRAGHLDRKIPEGYMQTIEIDFKQNKIKDPIIAEYLDKIIVITRNNLFEPKRLKEVFMINFGKYFTKDYYALKKHLATYKYKENNN